MLLDITKFSFKEALNNSKSKSSLGLFLGLIWGTFCIFLASFGCFLIYKKLPATEVFTLSGIYLAASTATLNIRRFSKDKEIITN